MDAANLKGKTALITGGGAGIGPRHRRSFCPAWRQGNYS